MEHELTGSSMSEDQREPTMNRLVVLLPVLNEALGLEWVLDRLPIKELHDRGYETAVLVMDGHSTDGTDKVAEQFDVLFMEQDETGKGTAIRHGFRETMAMGADTVVMLDADGTYHPSEMLNLLKGLDNADVVIGDRLNGAISSDAMTRFNFVGNHLLTWFATALYGVTTNDVCSGYWAFSREAIDRLMLNSVSFEIEAEMFASMIYQGLSFQYKPISYSARIGDAKLGSTADGWKILRKLITRRIFPDPLL